MPVKGKVESRIIKGKAEAVAVVKGKLVATTRIASGKVEAHVIRGQDSLHTGTKGRRRIMGGFGMGLVGLTTRDKILMVRQGISKKELIEIKDEAELDYDDLTNILSVSRATLINKKGKEKFNQSTSERILLLSDVVTYGRDVFGDSTLFTEWLKTPSEALGNVTPLSIMDTLYGIEEIKKELERIAHGVY